MPSSPPDGWADRLLRGLSEHEKERSASAPSLPRYEIRDRLGDGATAVVYRAWDKELGRPVALKTLRELLGLDAEARERFRREARVAAGLSHPHVVTLFDAGEAGGHAYLVMELIEGKPLAQILKEGSLDLRSLIRIMAQAARGVGAAHARGVIHRDLKPSNILITAEGEAKVVDFGLAQITSAAAELTRTGAPIGTPLYMCPEQAEGRNRGLTPAADVYSLGAILFEILTGRPPYTAEAASMLLVEIASPLPVPPRPLRPGAPRELEAVALRALEKNPARRYPDADAFAAELERHLRGEPVEAKAVGTVRQIHSVVRRHQRRVGIGVGAAAVFVIALVVALTITRQREEAVALLRESARISVDAALRLRRAGDAEGMRSFLPGIQAKYRQAVEKSPAIAEPDYLMGRMYRALMEDDKALQHQDRALGKDADFAPALYERVVLRSRKYGREYLQAYMEYKWLAQTERPELPRQGISREEVEQRYPRLRELREGILADASRFSGRLPSSAWSAATGILSYFQDEPEKAKAALERALAEDSQREEAWETLALALERLEALAATPEKKEQFRRERERVYTEGIAKDKGYAPLLQGRGLMRFQAGSEKVRKGQAPWEDFDAAEKDLREASSLARERADGWTPLATLELDYGEVLASRGRSPSEKWAEAEKHLDRAIELDDKSGGAWLRRARLHLLKGRHRMDHGGDPAEDWGRARRDISRAVELAPYLDDVWVKRGQLAMWIGQRRVRQGEDPHVPWVAALEDFNQAIRINSLNPEAFIQRGALWALYGLREAERDPGSIVELNSAEVDFTQALMLDASAAEAWTQRGILALRRGQLRAKRGEDPAPEWGAAEQDLAEALQLGESPEAWAARGELKWERAMRLEAAGRAAEAKTLYAECVRDLDQAAKINPDLEIPVQERRDEARARAQKK